MKFPFLKKCITLSSVGFAFALFACGDDDSGSTSAPSKQSVTSFDDLEECDEGLANQVFFVEDDSTNFFCNGKKWVAIQEEDIENVSSSSEKKGSSSSENKTASSDSKKESSSSDSKASSDSKKDSSSSGKTESSSSEAEESSSSYEKVDLSKMRPISGVAQIGRFKIGTDIKVYELDRDYLTQTGRVFTGMVSGENGEFTIDNIPGDVKVASVEADGFYTAEFFGTESPSRATVRALVSMDNATNVQINPVSTMAHDRAVYLAANEGLDVEQARKQAEMDVLKAFAMTSADTCFGQWDFVGMTRDSRGACADAAAAILLLLEAEGGFVGTLEHMARVAIDLKTDGVISDDSLNMAQMADSYLRRVVGNDVQGAKWSEYNPWPFTRDSVSFSSREYASAFVEATLGFEGSCLTAPRSDRYFYQNINRFSAYYNDPYTSFMCFGSQHRFVLADIVYRNTFYWEPLESCAEYKQGTVDPEFYFYYLGKWNGVRISAVDVEMNCCSKSKYMLAISKSTGEYKACDGQSWDKPKSSYFINNLVSCEGDLMGKTIVTETYRDYVYQYTCTESGWVCSRTDGEACPSSYIPKQQ